jgi:outer membrane protein OmpA-like peptidoglycan-associated protein
MEYIQTAEEDEEELARITRVMVEKSNEVIERTNAAQNRNDWDCGCTDVNLAATMRGIEDEELREGTWDGLAQKHVDEAGDSGLVVDAFGIVGLYPMYAWGTPELNSKDHILRRQSRIYRGDPLLLDPFDPSHEWFGLEGADFSGLGVHTNESVSRPTDLFISEYLIGSRVVPVVIPEPPELVKTTITLDSEVTFDLDKYAIRPEASPVLERIAGFLEETGIISEVLIEGHTCDLASDDYNQLLSERRAAAVMNFLQTAGFESGNIQTVGFGESRPRFPNDSEENRSKNRRVEITFLTRRDQEIQRTLSEDTRGSRSVEITYVKPQDRQAWQQQVQDYEVATIPIVNTDEEMNRVIEFYNGSDTAIDMGQGQYFLEIYGEDFEEIHPVAVSTPELQRHTLTIESGVTFELDKWEVRAEASETLQSIVEVINQADIFSEILIVGHTCDIATDEYNQLLSERRAESVREFLEGAGLEVDSIRTEGHGESEPVVPNISEENRSQNRRVEITFVTRDGREIERTVSAVGAKRKVEFSWISPVEDADSVEAAVIPLLFGDEFFTEGDDNPRAVIGLNGHIEPGETFIIAYDGSEEKLTDIADIVTGQLDFLPNETLVLRRFGGQRALACKAYTYAFLHSYPPHVIPIPEPLPALYDPICTDPNDCEDDELGSPN